MNPQLDPRVDEYIAQFPADIQTRLNAIRTVIRNVLPRSIEDISYKMPAYRLEDGKRAVVFFSAFEKHIGIYAVLTPDDSDLYKRIAPYNTGKGTLQFKNNEPLPLKLIAEVLAQHAIQVSSKATEKK
ncbi:MAG: DUF1801 domain-containing protein [Patescibacteria group bacterium]